jgi:uncharacterized protein (DUF1684 family)
VTIVSHLADSCQRKDAYFAHSPNSPLTPEQRRRFRGLAYYPENPDLVIVAPLLPVAEAGRRSAAAGRASCASPRRVGRPG